MKPFFVKTKDEEYYDSTDIDRTKAVYRLIIGERSNGKTYCIIRKAIDAYFDKKHPLPSAYIRRYAEELKGQNIARLIAPHLNYIQKKSKNRYNDVDYRTNCFWLVKRDNMGKIVEKNPVPLLYTAALSTWERSKGADRGEIKYFIFDEFLTRSGYLTNEFAKFANCHSSFVRNRAGVVTYMLANTVNPDAPYWDEMLIDNIEKLKQGEIFLYNYNNKKLTVAVERTLHATGKKDVEYYYAFDNPHLDMIKTGSWEEDSYPHLEKGWSINKENIVFIFYVIYNQHILKGNLIYEPREGSLFLYFHKFGNSQHVIKPPDIIFTNHPSTSVYVMHTFKDNPLNDRVEEILNKIKWCLGNEKVYYASNSVGEVLRNFMMNPFTSRGGRK